MSAKTRITFTLSPELCEAIYAKARSDNRSVSSYISQLCERDTAPISATGGQISDAQFAGLMVAAAKEDQKFKARALRLIAPALRGAA